MKSVELFSGGGGLAVGVEEAGFEHVALVEWNSHARATLKYNRPKWPLQETPDVRDVVFSKWEDQVDLVAGGPPCQPFSIGGVHRGDMDSRNMFPEAIRAVREIRPKAFMFENVRGLWRPAFRPYIEYIKLQLSHPWLVRKDSESWQDHKARLIVCEKSRIVPDGPEYEVDVRPISCSDYGAPQIRQRVIFMGYRKDLNIPLVFPSPTHSQEALWYSQNVSGEYWHKHEIGNAKKSRKLGSSLFAPQELPWVTVRDTISKFGLPAKVTNRVSIDHAQHVFIPGAKTYPGHDGSPLDLPAKALKAGVHGVPGGENMLRNENGSVRYFTVREAAALQGFPDDYMFMGAWGETMRQLGNAVPTMVATLFLKAIAENLNRASKQKSKQAV